MIQKLNPHNVKVLYGYVMARKGSVQVVNGKWIAWMGSSSYLLNSKGSAWNDLWGERMYKDNDLPYPLKNMRSWKERK